MSGRCGRWWWVAVVVAMLAPAAGARGQSQLATRGPRFLMAGSRSGGERDASDAPVLRRRVSLDLNGVTVDDALKELSRQAGLELAYSPRVVALDQPVTLKARDITVAAALTEILLDVAVDVSVTAGGHLALVQRPRVPAPLPADTGAVVGRVTDAQGGSPIVGATVTVDGTRASATTGADGRYRIGGLAVGTYTVRARYIGYTPSSQSVTVGAGEGVTADLALAKSAQELDQVVVTGTIVPTEVKALPTPVSVITANDIAQQRPHTVQELFRQIVPTAVSWDIPAVPAQTAYSVRGSNTLSPGSGQMKVIIDGLEAAWSTYAAVDPNSVDRIEVVRGPQAAALYGSDAIGGVIQIFTKRGDAGLPRPEVEGQAALGVVQTPYAGYGGVLRQNYSASVRGGSADMGYNFGAGYSRTADYIPDGEQSRQSSPSVYGGMRFTRGVVSVDLTGRYYVQNNPAVFNPDLSQTGFYYWSEPLHEPGRYQNQAIGGRVILSPATWLHSTITVGLDRFTQDLAQSQPRLTTPGDTLLEIFNQTREKTFIGFNTSLEGRLGATASASLTTGFDHYSLPITQYFTSGALTTTGTVQTESGQPVTVSRTTTTNTGYFAQAQIGFRGAAFLSGGLRVEQNTNFGDSLGTQISPRIGASFVQRLARASTLKFRGSYGRSIRAPSPGQKLAFVSTANVLVANPVLGPERQRGWDAGIDASFGSSATLSLTYYDQVADNLIQLVQLSVVPLPTSQYQNVGQVRNKGLEVEGGLHLGGIQLKAQYGYVRSRIRQLAPNYAGDLRVGDQSLGTPTHTAGVSLSVTPLRGTNVGLGVTYVGSWSYYDLLAEYRCFGGTGPCQPTFRDYITAYPGFVRANATVSQEITPLVSGFVSVENLTNNQAFELVNSTPAFGRISVVGFRLRY
jgi:outer membrane receptor protein involved in Fe transport